MEQENSLAWDDTLEFNTQISSQWDSLVHVQHMPSGLAYNGLQVTEGGLTASQTTAENTLPTLDHWHTRGGLVGRGVLIDFKAYMDDVVQPKPPYHAFGGYRITVEEVEAVAKHQGVEFRQGDILIIRTGATEVMEDPTPQDLDKLQQGKLSGLHGTEDSARWVWNKHFAAVAGDSLGFEAIPPLRPDGTEGTIMELGESYSLTRDRFRSYCWVWLTTPPPPQNSPPSILPVLVWPLDRRAVGSQEPLSTLPEDWEIQFLADLCSAKPPWAGGVAAKRFGDLLSR